jgi:hypothetical protein
MKHRGRRAPCSCSGFFGGCAGRPGGVYSITSGVPPAPQIHARRLNWSEPVSRAQCAPTKGPSRRNQRLGTIRGGAGGQVSRWLGCSYEVTGATIILTTSDGPNMNCRSCTTASYSTGSSSKSYQSGRATGVSATEKHRSRGEGQIRRRGERDARQAKDLLVGLHATPIRLAAEGTELQPIGPPNQLPW